MTMLLIMEAIDSGQINLEDQVPVSEHARSMGGSQIWLEEAETLSVHEMLKAITVVSANDASVAMAELISGSEQAFVEKMNARAKELGMNDTTFKNCHGIDEDGHVTSAHDIAIMSRELMNNHPTITDYTLIWMDSLRDGQSQLVNTNKMIRTYNGTTGLKTGSTSIALFNLSATATRGDLSLVAVVMKSETSAIRFAEASKLLDYGFANFEYAVLSVKDEEVKSIEVEKGVANTVTVVFETDTGTLVPKGTSGNITSSMDLKEIVSAPVTKGQVLGEIIYSIDGEIVGSTNLVAGSDIMRINFSKYAFSRIRRLV
ncbi:MAG: D-alanyl-D-alanine carboxypeptidase [Oscillospiraceae bacterium]|nr:D-alanyl-D-alanine carboxypeptidase [Oscillospiraceae bacterium]